MEANRLVFRVHAIRRMFQRHISEKEVRHVLETGETIETYPEDRPYAKLVSIRAMRITPASCGGRG
jgi:hypothetical protein